MAHSGSLGLPTPWCILVLPDLMGIDPEVRDDLFIHKLIGSYAHFLNFSRTCELTLPSCYDVAEGVACCAKADNMVSPVLFAFTSPADGFLPGLEICVFRKCL